MTSAKRRKTSAPAKKKSPASPLYEELRRALDLYGIDNPGLTLHLLRTVYKELKMPSARDRGYRP